MSTVFIAKAIIANFFLFLIVSGIGVLKGLDIKKRSSWLLALYGFLSGFLASFLRQDDYENLKFIVDWKLGLQLGILFAFAVMYVGVTNRWHRQRFRKMPPDN
jgi:hypothetical protein